MIRRCAGVGEYLFLPRLQRSAKLQRFSYSNVDPRRPHPTPSSLLELRRSAMASGQDVRDIFGLPNGAGTPKPPAQQRKKSAVPTRKAGGVAREVAALYGERPPPVAVYEEKKTYRAKRQSTGPAKKW